MYTWKLHSSVCAAVLLWAATAHSAQTGASSPVSAERTNTMITSQKMTVRNQESKAIFEGTVVLTKGTLIVHSDVMVISFRPSDQPASAGEAGNQTAEGSKDAGMAEKGTRSGAGELPVLSNRSVSMIEATGRVKIEKAEGRATCREAIYYVDEEKIVLTGDPVAWQKGTRVTGKKITMYLAEDRSVVEGGSRVLIDESGGNSR